MPAAGAPLCRVATGPIHQQMQPKVKKEPASTWIKKKQKHTTLQSSCSRKSMRVDEIWIDMVYRKETFMTKTKIEPISFSQRNEALASFHH